MTPQERRELLTVIGWKAIELTRRLHISSATVSYALDDQYDKPLHPDEDDWLFRIAAAIEAMPPPVIVRPRGPRPGSIIRRRLPEEVPS